MVNQVIKKVLNHSAETVETGALILAGTGLFGALLGLIKNALLASTFGAGQELDIYFAAFRIPDFFHTVFIYGAVGSGLLPVFSRFLTQGKEKAWELVSALLMTFFVLFGALAVVIFFFANPIADLLVPGFSSQAAGEVARLLRVLMLQPIFLGISNIAASTLQAFRKFVVYSLAPVFYNIGIIIGILWFSRSWGIMGVVWGVVLGAFLHFLIQWSTFRSLGFKFSWKVREGFRGVREALALMLPRALTLAAGQINLLILTMIASLLPIGTLAIYNFADSLQGVPQTLLAVSFVTAAFPALSELWARSDTKAFGKLFAKTLAEIFMWTVPAALILLAFRQPLVHFTLAYGNFDLISQEKTVNTFSVFLLALPVIGLRFLLLRAFFASGDTRLPLLSYLLSTVVTILSAYKLGQLWEATGLAMAIVLGSIFDSLILFLVLRARLKNLYLRDVRKVLGRSVGIGALAASLGWFTFWLTQFFMKGESYWTMGARAFIGFIPTALVLFAGILMYKVFDLRAFSFSAEPEPRDESSQ